MDQEQILAKFLQTFDPFESLTPDDPRYVECDQARSSVRLLNTLERVVKRANKPTCQLLSGHRGCGKTTELQQLKQRLTADAVYYVVYCDAEDLLNLRGIVEYTDVMRAILQRVAEEAETQSITLTSGKVVSFLQGLWEILSMPVEITGGNIKNALGQLNFDLKRNPSQHAKVREYLRANTDTFTDAVNETIQKAADGFRASDANCKGMAVFVDNLDRILPETVTGTSRNNHDDLFIHSASRLTALECNVIYTIPSALRYSTSGAKLRTIYGNPVQTLPMIPVIRKQTAEEHDEGLRTLTEIIKQRLNAVGAEGIFDSDETIRRLCTISGGYVRQLMTLASSASINCTSLPITRNAVEEAVIDLRNNIFPSIRPYLETLRKVAQTNAIDEISESEECLKLLDNLAILEYLDDDGYWYDVNPIIRVAKEFAA